MFVLRFFAPLALVLCLVAYLMLPWTDQLFQHWSETDVQMRSRLIFSTLSDDLPNVLSDDRPATLAKKFTQLAHDERLIGVAYCPNDASPKFRSKGFPTEITCPQSAKGKPEFVSKAIKGGLVMVATFPIEATLADGGKNIDGAVLIVNDMSFAEARSEQTRYYVLAFMFVLSLLASVITIAMARLMFSRWVLGLRDFVRTGRRGVGLPREAIGLTRELQQRIRQIEREHQRPLVAGPRWTAETLFDFVHHHLPSEQLITVSHRQPYAHFEKDGKLEWMIPASGLVTAIEPIMKACKGTWIAVASGEADRKAADENGVLAVPPDAPSYKLHRLWLSKEEEAGFYAGLANEGIWSLCHMAYVKPRFRASDWEMYRAVNQKFADAVVAEAKSDSPIVFIQDYHFGLLPKMIRERLPNALIIVFWHIPWPNSEVFGILPWRETFLSGLLAADIVGFHTQYLCNNFLDCVDTYIEALIDREHNTVRHGDDFCMIRPYPISIAWPDMQAAGVPAAAECRAEMIEKLGLPKGVRTVVGVERLDYIKGIPERLNAFGIFLDRNPEWLGKVCFVQIASPSRSVIAAYAEIDREVEAAAAAINARHGDGEWQPVHILKQNFGQADVYRFYRAADVCIVSSLHDGMNLVAKEFVAAREDEQGVLILSQFAGSSRELVDALLVNPYDEEKLAQSFLRALQMAPEEQQARIRNMREHVRSHNIFAWAAEVLGDASSLHRRRQLNSLLQGMTDSEERESEP